MPFESMGPGTDGAIQDNDRNIVVRWDRYVQGEFINFIMIVNHEVYEVRVVETLTRKKDGHIWRIWNIKYPATFSGNRRDVERFALEGIDAFRRISFARSSDKIKLDQNIGP